MPQGFKGNLDFGSDLIKMLNDIAEDNVEKDIDVNINGKDNVTGTLKNANKAIEDFKKKNGDIDIIAEVDKVALQKSTIAAERVLDNLKSKINKDVREVNAIIDKIGKDADKFKTVSLSRGVNTSNQAEIDDYADLIGGELERRFKPTIEHTRDMMTTIVKYSQLKKSFGKGKIGAGYESLFDLYDNIQQKPRPNGGVENLVGEKYLRNAKNDALAQIQTIKEDAVQAALTELNIPNEIYKAAMQIAEQAAKQSMPKIRSKSLNDFYKKAEEVKNKEIAVLLDNYKISSDYEIGNDKSVKIPNGKGNMVIHSHEYDSNRNNLRFGTEDIEKSIIERFQHTLLRCGEEFLDIDFSKIPKDKLPDLQTALLDKYSAVSAFLGGELKEIEENGVKGVNVQSFDEFSDDLYNTAVSLVNSYVVDIVKQYGGSVNYLRRNKNGDVVLDNKKLPTSVPKDIDKEISYFDKALRAGDYEATSVLQDNWSKDTDSIINSILGVNKVIQEHAEVIDKSVNEVVSSTEKEEKAIKNIEESSNRLKEARKELDKIMSSPLDEYESVGLDGLQYDLEEFLTKYGQSTDNGFDELLDDAYKFLDTIDEARLKLESTYEETNKFATFSPREFMQNFGTPSEALDYGDFDSARDIIRALGADMAHLDSEAEDFSERKLNVEFFKALLKDMQLTEDELTVVKAAFADIETYYDDIEHGRSDAVTRYGQIDQKLYDLKSIALGEYIISDEELERAKQIVSIIDEVNTETRNAEPIVTEKEVNNVDEITHSYQEVYELVKKIADLQDATNNSPTFLTNLLGKGEFLQFAQQYLPDSIGPIAEEVAKANIKSGYNIYTRAKTKFGKGEVDQSYLDNAYTTFVEIASQNIAKAFNGTAEHAKQILGSVLPKKMNDFVDQFADEISSFKVRNTEYHKKYGKDIETKLNSSIKDLINLGIGGHVESLNPDDDLFADATIDDAQRLQNIFDQIKVSSDNMSDVLKLVCSILGVEIPQNADKAETALRNVNTAITSSDKPTLPDESVEKAISDQDRLQKELEQTRTELEALKKEYKSGFAIEVTYPDGQSSIESDPYHGDFKTREEAEKYFKINKYNRRNAKIVPTESIPVDTWNKQVKLQQKERDLLIEINRLKAESEKKQHDEVDTSVHDKLQEELKQDETVGKQSTEVISQGLNEVSSSADKASESIQRVTYHWGNLAEGSPSHPFGEEIKAYTQGLRNGGRGWADGTGTYVTGNPNEFKRGGDFSNELKKFYAIDTSKLKLYEQHVEEGAQAYYDFSHKLEQYCYKMGSGFDGFDDNLKDINPEILYKEVQKLFGDSSMTFEEFNFFLNKMTSLVKESGIKADGTVNSMKMFNFKKQYGTDDIKTRFLKELGYQGTDFFGTSFDGIKNGSVIFQDVDKAILATGKSIDEVISKIGVEIPQASDKAIQKQDEYQAELDQTEEKAKELAKILSMGFHNSDELFNYFDVTKQGEHGDLLGKAAYFSGQPNDSFSREDFGKYQTIWNLNLQKTFDVLQGFTDNQIEQIMEKYFDDKSDQLKTDIRNALKQVKINPKPSIANLQKIGNIDFGEILESLGYDSAYNKLSDEIAVYNPSRVSRLDNRYMDNATKQWHTEEVEKFENELDTVQSELRETAQVGTIATNTVADEMLKVSKGAEKSADSIERIVTMYRAFNSQHGVVGNGMSWFSDDIETAASYYKNLVFSGGKKDKLAKLKADVSDFMSIDAHGGDFKSIAYAGKFYTAEELAELAKQLGYVGLEIKNVYDSLNGADSELKSSIYTIFDENIADQANESTKKLETKLETITKLREYTQDTLFNSFNGKKVSVVSEAQDEFNKIIETYKSGAITIEQAFDQVNEAKERILISNESPIISDKQSSEVSEVTDKLETQNAVIEENTKVKRENQSVPMDSSAPDLNTVAEKAFQIDTHQTEVEKFNQEINEVAQTSLVAANNAEIMDNAFETALTVQKGNISQEVERVEGEIVETTKAINDMPNGLEMLIKFFEEAFARSERLKEIFNDIYQQGFVLVPSSADESNVSLDREANALLAIEDKANQAAESKNKFEKANKRVKKSADDSSDSLEKEQRAFEVLLGKLTKLRDINGDKYIPDFKNQISKIEQDYQKLIDDNNLTAESLNKLRTDAQALWDTKSLPQWKAAAEKSITGLMAKLEKFGRANSAMSKQFKQDLDRIRQALKDDLSIPEVSHLSAELNRIEAEVNHAGKTGLSMLDMIKDRSKGISAQFLAQYFSWQDMFRYSREAFQAIYDLDTALIDLKKTTAMSSQELNEFYMSSNNIAKSMGVTTKEIIEQASSWSRLGYNTKEAAETMAELSSQFASISPGMTTDEAQTGLVSIMKAWDVDVSDVEREIMDNINVLGNKFAETNNDIVEGMKRAGATLSAIGMDINDSFALFTGAQEIIQNAETVGTALKTLSLRIRGYDEETEELSDDVIAATGKVADLTKVASNNFAGVSLWKDAGQTEYKSLVTYLGEISEIWDEIGAKQQTDLLNNLFGKRGASVGSAILQNFNQVRTALVEMESAGGAADAEMGIIRESWQYKLNELKQTWVGVLQEMIDRGQINDLLDKLIRLSEIIGKIAEAIGPIPSLIAAIGLPQVILHIKEIPDILSKLVDTNIISEIFGNKTDNFANDVIEQFQSVPLEMVEIGEEASKSFTDSFDVNAAKDFLSQANGEQIFKDAELDNVPLEFEVKPFDVEEASKSLADAAKDGAVFKDIEEEAEKTVETVNRTFGGINLDETQKMLENLDKDNPFDELTDKASMEVKQAQEIMDGEFIQLGQIDVQAVEDNINAIEDVFGNLPNSAKDSVTQTLDVLDDLAAQDDWKFGVGDVVEESMSEIPEVVEDTVQETVDKLHELAEMDWNFKDPMEDSMDDVKDVISDVTEEISDQISATDIEFDFDVTEIEEGTEAVSDFVSEIDDVATDEFSSGLQSVGNSANFAALKMAALNLAINVGVMLAVGAAIKIFTECAAAEDNLRKKTSQLSSEYKNVATDIDDYKEKINKLKDVINDESTSYDEAVQARKDLLEIQDTLIEKYGSEADGIDIVTTAIRNQTDALDELKAKKWQETLNEVNEQKGPFGLFSWWNNVNHGTDQLEDPNLKTILKQMTEVYEWRGWNELGKKGFFTEKDKEIMESLSQEFESLSTNEYNFNISGDDLETVYQDLLKIQERVDDLGGSGKLKQNLTDIANGFKKTLDSYGGFYKQYVENEVILGSAEYSKMADNVADAASAYKEAYAKNDSELIAESVTKFREAYAEALNSGDSQLVHYFEKEYAGVLAEIDKWEIGQKVNAKIEEAFSGKDNISSLRKGVEEELRKLEKDGNVDLVLRPVIDDSELAAAGWGRQPGGKATVYTSTFTNEDESVAMNFTPILCDENGNYIRTLTPSALQQYAEEVIAGVHEDTLGLKIGATFTGKDALQQAEEAAEKIHELHDQYFLQKQHYSDNSFVNNQVNALQGTKLSDLTDGFGELDARSQYAFKSLLNYFGLTEEEAGVLRGLLVDLGAVYDDISDKSDGSFKIADFSSSLSGMKKLTSLYSTWKKQVEDDPTKVSLDITEVESALRSIGEENGIDISGVVGSEEFENFERIVGNSASTAQQVEAAFDSLGVAIVANTVDLKNLKEEDAGLVQTQLESLGVLNAKEIVTAALTDSEIQLTTATEQHAIQEAALAEEAALASGAAYDEAVSMAGLTGATELTRNAVFLLVAQEEIFSNQDLNISQKVSALSELASAHLTAANAAKVNAYAEQLAANAEHYGLTGNNATAYFDSMMNNYLNNMEELNTAAIEVKMNLSGLGGAASDAGKGAGKAADKAEELAKALDELKQAYDDLKDIRDTYNKTGKISVDQYKKLLNMDFRYIAALKKEGNQVKLDEKALEGLQQAELAAAQAELYNRLATVADTIAKMSDAEITAYLAQTNIAEANSALEVAKAALLAKIAILEQGSAAQQAAAEMLKLAMANAAAFGEVVDFNLDTSSLSESAADAADDMEEEFEEVFDWIERRIEMLDKQLEYLAAKLDLVSNTRGFGILDKQLDTLRKKLETQQEGEKTYLEEANKYMEMLPEDIQDKIKSGANEIQTLQGKENKELAETIDKAKEWYDKYMDIKTAALETKKAIQDTYVEKVSRYTNQMDYDMWRREERNKKRSAILSAQESYGNFITSAIYNKQAGEYRNYINSQLKVIDKMQKELDEGLRSGEIKKNSQAYQDMVKAIREAKTSIYEAKASFEELKKEAREAARALQEFKDEYRKGYGSEMGSIYDLFDSEKAFTDEGLITSTGLGMTAMLEGQLNTANMQTAEYTRRLAELDKEYAEGKFGAQEYYEEQEKLREAMYESASTAKAAKDAIISLAREGIEKQISTIEDQITAYKELIDKQKEALDSEKELHNYRKSIAESNKSIAKLERQLAAMANDQSQATVAKRKKLEAQLADARAAKEEKEYEHSIQLQKDALDQNYEDYKTEKDAEIKKLKEYSKNAEKILQDMNATLNIYQKDALEAVNTVAAEYGVTIRDAITEPLKTAESYVSGIVTNIRNEISKINEQIAKSQEDQKRQAANVWKEEDLQNVRASINQKITSAQKASESAKQALEDAKKARTKAKKDYGKDSAQYAAAENKVQSAKATYTQKNQTYKELKALLTAIDDQVKTVTTYNYDSAGTNEQVQKKYIEYREAKNKAYEANSTEEYNSWYNKAKKLYAEYVSLWNYARNMGINMFEYDEKTKKFTTKINNNLLAFAKGAHNLKKDQWAWTQEEGSEIILSPSRNAVLSKLNAGDSVLTHEQSENLYKLSKLNISDLLKGMIGNSIASIPVNNTQTMNSLNIENLVTINGNVSDDNVKLIQKTCQDAVKQAFNRLNAGIRK